MKLGETIDYMMENEIVSTIKTNDGNVIIMEKCMVVIQISLIVILYIC